MNKGLNTLHTALGALVLVQSVTAGGFIAGTWNARQLHMIGGSALPLIASVITLVAWVVVRRGTWPRRSAILSTIATLLIWVETGLGHVPTALTTAIHVPLGVAIFGLLMMLGHPRSSVEASG